MRRRDFLIGGALGFAVPLLAAGPARAAWKRLAASEGGLPVRVTWTPAEGAILAARDRVPAIRPDELVSGDPGFVTHGAQVTCHGLVTGPRLAGGSDLAAVRHAGFRGLSIELEYPGSATAGARLQRFWSYTDRGVPNVGRSCAATLPIEQGRGLALHLTVQREGRPDSPAVLRLSPGREAHAPKLRRGHYLLSISTHTRILVEVDHANGACGAARA